MKKLWLIKRIDHGVEGVEYRVYDPANNTMVCAEIVNKKEADLIRAAPIMKAALSEAIPVIKKSTDPVAERLSRQIQQILILAS